ncbi:MAG: DUF1887 family protein [Clostridia bacterium]|nr:DUF1887 family protein [Clostridia bacterium]
MTLIEFFEKSVVENICTSIVHAPERVILVGYQKGLLNDHAQRYREFFLKHGHDIDFKCKNINKNDVATIVKTLEEIIEQYPDCIIDVTGGEDLYIFAAGIVCERHRDKNIQVHYINIRSGVTYDCDMDGEKISQDNPLSFTVEDNVSLYGGRVIYEDEMADTTHLWDMNEEFKRDIRTLWSICKEDCGMWNWQMDVLGAAELYREPDTEPEVTVCSRDVLLDHQERNGRNRYLFNNELIKKLIKAKLISSFEFDKSKPVHIEYKNEQIKRCLTKSGQALELIVYLAALEAKEKNGNPTYNDVMTGVFLDWDGELQEKRFAPGAENEVDVIMMRGMIPVFVSCKNGNFSADELYKLQSVANKFGGKYAKKVLIAPMLEKNSNKAAIIERCNDMQINLIGDVEEWNEDKLYKEIKVLWSKA